MPTLHSESRKSYRKGLTVHCGLSAEDTACDLSFSASGDVAAIDTNISTSLDNNKWDMRNLTDLSGGGFPLDGSCELYSTLAGSLADGKVGIRSDIGGEVNINVSGSRQFTAVTVAITGGNESGRIIANGKTYPARRIVVIPVNATSLSIKAESLDANRRIVIASIVPGIAIDFDNENLISCKLNLRSNLAIESPTWEISEIEIEGYYPDDISEALSNVNDDVPIWYESGYAEDMAPMRFFYLSEAAKMEGNIITLHGQDASHKLDNLNNVCQLINSNTGNGDKKLYDRFVKFITDSGIKLMEREQSPATGSGDTKYSAITKEATSRSMVAEIMNLSHAGNLWITFVDAGIPRVYHTKPTSKWDIYEEDCSSPTRTIERNIGKIASQDTYGLQSTVTRKTEWKNLAKKNVEKDEDYKYKEEDTYFWAWSVSNAKDIVQSAKQITWVAKKDTTKKKQKVKGKTKTVYSNQSVVKGKKAKVVRNNKSILHENRRPGITLNIEPYAYGRIYQGTSLRFPNYKALFDRSNVTGAFTTRGDPRMQPRDIFTFHRLDGTTEVCTIESIALSHEKGGTTAEITYRKGIC